MTNLPEKVRMGSRLNYYEIYNIMNSKLIFLFFQVSEDDIEEMFNFADKDRDGKISFLEFQLMINPPKLDSDTSLKKSKSKEGVKKVTIIEHENKSN